MLLNLHGMFTKSLQDSMWLVAMGSSIGAHWMFFFSWRARGSCIFNNYLGVSSCFFAFDSGSCHIAQVGLELTIQLRLDANLSFFLAQLPEC